MIRYAWDWTVRNVAARAAREELPLELPGPDPTWPRTDPRWPSIRFAPNPLQALAQIYEAAGELDCGCYWSGHVTADGDADPYEVQCARCRIRHLALYSTPAVYAVLEPSLPKPEPSTDPTEEPPF